MEMYQKKQKCNSEAVQREKAPEQRIQFQDNRAQHKAIGELTHSIALQRKIGFEFEVPRTQLAISLPGEDGKNNYEESQIDKIGSNVKLTLDNGNRKKNGSYLYNPEFVNIAPYDETKDAAKAVADWGTVVAYIDELRKPKILKGKKKVKVNKVSKGDPCNPIRTGEYKYEKVVDGDENNEAIAGTEKPFEITIKNHNITGNPQATAGITLNQLPNLVNSLTANQSANPIGYGGSSKASKSPLTSKNERIALRRAFSELSGKQYTPEVIGYIGLIKSYIDVHRQVFDLSKGKGEALYAKFLLPIMSRTDFASLYGRLSPTGQTTVQQIIRGYLTQNDRSILNTDPASSIFRHTIKQKRYSPEAQEPNNINNLTIGAWLNGFIPISNLPKSEDVLKDTGEPGLSMLNPDEEETLQSYGITQPTEIGNDRQGTILEIRAMQRGVPYKDWPKLISNCIALLEGYTRVKNQSTILPPLQGSKYPQKQAPDPKKAKPIFANGYGTSHFSRPQKLPPLKPKPAEILPETQAIIGRIGSLINQMADVDKINVFKDILKITDNNQKAQIKNYFTSLSSTTRSSLLNIQGNPKHKAVLNLKGHLGF